MKKNLNMALKRRSSEQGFAIPLAVGIGLIMILISSTMIVRSQDDEVTGLAQKSTAKSLSIAETGITRVESFLNKNRGFANHSYPWTQYLENIANPCTSGSLYTEAADFNNWISVGANDQFRVISYTPSSTEGVLVVEGQARRGNSIISKTRLQARIPLNRTRIPSFAPPGAWAQSFGLGNNRITGSVIDAGCPPGSLNADERIQISGDVLTDPSLTLPPPATVPPGAISLPAITSGTTLLPRSSDSPNANGEYVYHVASSSGDSIDLRGGGEQLIIKPGQKVAIYLDGNIQTQGSGVKIGHNCYDTDNPADGKPDGTTEVSGCAPTNFQIFGGTNTTSILLGGSNTIDAFIFAPNAINSGVNGNAQIRGSVWLKEWDAANGNHTVIVQTAGWNNIPSKLWPPRLSPLSSWQRQEAP